MVPNFSAALATAPMLEVVLNDWVIDTKETPC
jgi:hypothetical protein